MDVLNSLNIGTAAEIGVTALLCYGLTAAVKQSKLDNKWLAWISMLVGIICGLVVTAYYKDSLFTGALMGLIVGSATSGLYDGFKGITKTSITNNTDDAFPNGKDGDYQ